MALDKFYANNNGSFDPGDIAAKAGDLLTNKFDLDNDGVIEATEVAQEILITTGIGHATEI